MQVLLYSILLFQIYLAIGDSPDREVSATNCESDKFYYSASTNRPPNTNEIARAGSKCLWAQRAIFTWPSINKTLIQRTFHITLPDTVASFVSFVYEQYIRLTLEVTHAGGIILYDYNFLGDIDADKDFIESLKSDLKTTLIFINEHNGSAYRVNINPLIVADCVPFNVPIAYCRGAGTYTSPEVNGNDPVDVQGQVKAYETYIDFYKKLGLVSSLGPAVDFYASEYGDSSALTSFAEQVAVTMKGRSFIPVLKHFMYDGTIADAHYSSSLRKMTENDFIRELEPYDAVNQKLFPFVIMTTHQANGFLDTINGATQSPQVYQFINSRLPNAVVMSDSISMDGMRGTDFFQKLSTGQADIFIIHLGLYFPRRQFIDSKAALGHMSQDVVALEKILKLKQYYGQLVIQELTADR